jgi:hypothetical protein
VKFPHAHCVVPERGDEHGSSFFGLELNVLRVNVTGDVRLPFASDSAFQWVHPLDTVLFFDGRSERFLSHVYCISEMLFLFFGAE